jgi:hypothetical protein
MENAEEFKDDAPFADETEKLCGGSSVKINGSND